MVVVWFCLCAAHSYLFNVQQACCFCGGGSDRLSDGISTLFPTSNPAPQPTTPGPTPNPTRPPTSKPSPSLPTPAPTFCSDSTAWVDRDNDSCIWYEQRNTCFGAPGGEYANSSVGVSAFEGTYY
jgi:hypothetical protein